MRHIFRGGASRLTALLLPHTWPMCERLVSNVDPEDLDGKIRYGS